MRDEGSNQKGRDGREDWNTFLRHEIRGGLGPALGFADLLIRNHGVFTDDQVLEYLTAIRDSILRLYGILDLTAEIQALRRGETQLDRSGRDLRETVGGAVEEARIGIRKRHPDHPAICRIASGPAVCEVAHDRLRFQRALRILIEGIWEETREAVAVDLESRDDGVRVRLGTAGGSVAWDRLAGILESAGSIPSGRTALGFALARCLVEAHNGEVSVAASPCDEAGLIIRLPKGRP